ncbi:hypothetical protein [Glacieibacterium frigidum]|uniref:DUF3108 domain-containing protein n=1 Tax=Glacieibacterium frigidum TaxID=2593303 RepID=A0A552U7V3_9SPHN|nr:hypothetical protein [Glacieibacterium frigidum]TRW14291.1 hypothetical protein FMM06_11275 [Glacieibacterium frigidum]
MRFDRLALAAVALATLAAAPRADSLPTGRLTYRITIDGQPHGEQILTVRRAAPDRYAITMDAPAIGQRWDASSDGDFRPVAAKLEMPTRAGPYAMALDYGAGRVTGTHGTTATPVDDALPPGTIDQRIDWAYVAAARLPRGGRLAFRVYDPATKVSRAEAHGLGLRWVDVGGRRTSVRSTAYRIVKAGGTEHYVVHVAAAGPAIMVREDMPNGLRIDLIDFTASPR